MAEFDGVLTLDLNKANPHGTLATKVENLLDLLERSEYLSHKGLLEQVREQTTPRIDEPGSWGVVHATYDGEDEGGTEEFVRFPDGLWHSTGFFGIEWHQLRHPVLVRPGVG